MTDAKLRIESIDPYCGSIGPWLLKDKISLAAGDYDFIPLATYNEVRNPQWAARETAFRIEANQQQIQPMLDATEKNILVIRAMASGAPPEEIKCKLWVDEKGKFQIEEI